LSKHGDLLLSADDTDSHNFNRACKQIRTEHGETAGSNFAFDYGYIGHNWTGSTATLMERVAEKHGYRVDWHGADKEGGDE